VTVEAKEQEMAQDNRATLERTIEATFRGDWETAGQAMADDSVVEWPQSGERIVGREACLTVYRNYPGGSPPYQLRRISGGPEVFTVEAVGDYSGDRVYLTSIIEFRDGKIAKQTDYWANAFEAPAWRGQWVQRMS
jgi:ketosteroid isomerase-like protein